jgi:DNA-binding NtrC family response regulator
VDDEPAILLSYRIILEQKGYEVFSAKDSTSATALLKERPFNLLLCDLGLERPLSGMDVVRWARENRPAMPCILLTGYPDDRISEETRGNGIHTLFKPVEVPLLLETIHSMINGIHEKSPTHSV